MSTDQSVIKIVQELLSAEPTSSITPALISEKIDLALTLNPRWAEGCDREKATAELIRRFSMWIGQDTSLKNMVGHEAWLDAARKQNWRYWQRYREWTERKLASAALDALDTSTDTVLGLLEDPRREGSWDRRGLVVGHVQSGKTGHYSGLISKAADSGYKIIIVLAGLHNNLRSQTQIRLDEGFLGYETAPNVNDIRAIGVGLIDADPAIRPNFATNRTNTGDFNTAFANKLGISPEQRPWLFVVKKNKTVLIRLLEWIRNRVADAAEAGTGRKIVTNLPLLVIDDEADHASVDTGQQEFDENGQPDAEYEPKAINSLIRQILHSFQKKAYVGYTATPFANIFIHERGSTAEEGDDLFPAAFIINLGAPSNYIGPSQIFGVKTPEGRTSGLPLVRPVDDHAEWMPQSHKSHHRPETADPSDLPASLREAIHSFLLATAIRYLRGQRSEHSSMLVHVTRFKNVQDIVHKRIGEYFRQLKQRLTRGIGNEAIETELARLWAEDFAPSGDLVRERLGKEIPAYPNWEEIRAVLADVCADIEVRMINGTAKDVLDYADNATGLKVIAVGGDKLSRGLTLEGLMTSYFLRASKMYDTLMQMGRWFGYRPGYLDVCRLYTTSDLQEWFGHIADAAAELREEFEVMAASGATPREYGLKVQSHPVLMVTSQLKMRTAETLLLSFSGSLVETVSLFRDKDNLDHNRRATETFLSSLQAPESNPSRTFGDVVRRWNGSHIWEGVAGDKVADFMAAYRTQPTAYKVNSPLIADFIRKMTAVGALTQWTVVLLGGGAGDDVTLAPGATVKGIQRSMEAGGEATYSIGRLISPRDETIDFNEDAWLAALKLTQDAYTRDPERSRAKSLPEEPNGPAIRRIRGKGAAGVPPHPERGLLLLYAIDPGLSGLPSDLPPVIGFAASFPESEAGVKVQYKVNNVFMELEYGTGG